jgi:hypothetical protein
MYESHVHDSDAKKSSRDITIHSHVIPRRVVVCRERVSRERFAAMTPRLRVASLRESFRDLTAAAS